VSISRIAHSRIRLVSVTFAGEWEEDWYNSPVKLQVYGDRVYGNYGPHSVTGTINGITAECIATQDNNRMSFLPP